MLSIKSNSNSNSNLNENENINVNKKFAIFITSYNYGEFIGQAIESVINQSDPDWYLYIFDNCSTDNTYEVVEKYLKKDSRISWKKHETNIGAIPNLISGFKEIDADYISTLQADDWLEPNFIADAKKAFAENPEIPFCAFGWSSWEKYQADCPPYMQNADLPVAKNFSQKIYLSPFLVFKNIIAMHFLVFQKSCFMKILPEIEFLQFQQLLEPFLIKRLENLFGASYLNSNCHGYWRRHFQQITVKNNQNFQINTEQLSEPLFFCSEINSNSNLADLATKFMTLINYISQGKIPYKTATEWLLSDLGKPFAEKFGNLNFEFIKANNLEKSLLCLAVSVWSAFIFNANFGGWENDINETKKQLFLWIKDLKNAYQIKHIETFFEEANKFYDNYFLPAKDIKKLAKIMKKEGWIYL